MGGIVVDDEVQIARLRRGAVDVAQELQELLVAVALEAAADHLAGGDVEGGKQGRGAVPLVVVGHGAGAALLKRQPRLRSVQRLDLALFIDTQHQGLVRRVEVEPHNVGNLLAELGIVGRLKVFIKCGFSPCAAQMRCTLE